jgi:hypothetical protein
MNVRTEFCAEIFLDVAPEIGGYDASVFKCLRGAGKVCNDTSELFVLIGDEKHFNSAVVSAFELGEVGEIAEVWLNGEYIGARINAPYKFDLSGALKDKNDLTVIVTSNLAHRRRDWLSTFVQIPPSGIIGEIHLEAND